MSKESSFDIVSEVDLQEIDNAVNQATKEIENRYDLKKSRSSLTLNKGESRIFIESENDFTLKSVIDVLNTKVIKRGISLKALSLGAVEPAAGGRVRQKIDVVQGVSKDQAKDINKLIKDSKIKVKVTIDGDKLRVTGKSKDELQEVISLLKEYDLNIPLQFTNYR
ncbi:MAG: YajQ family cyclic di-GMP-binding protein [Actinomycetota bacterium]|nr:YajQ family cyclic di-GMP-binding protein [Actinomycetota bacterium]